MEWPSIPYDAKPSTHRFNQGKCHWLPKYAVRPSVKNSLPVAIQAPARAPSGVITTLKRLRSLWLLYEATTDRAHRRVVPPRRPRADHHRLKKPYGLILCLWHVSDMLMDTGNVPLLRKTRSDQRRVKTTRLTHTGPRRFRRQPSSYCGSRFAGRKKFYCLGLA
jgi:hypothetical protein